MINKRYWLEKWRSEMCRKLNSAKCLCNALDCSDCIYNADYNIINIEECSY